jgi:hypothetical protein
MAFTIGKFGLGSLTKLGVLMLTSKGSAGVTGSGFVTLAATFAAIPPLPASDIFEPKLSNIQKQASTAMNEQSRRCILRLSLFFLYTKKSENIIDFCNSPALNGMNVHSIWQKRT